MLVTIANFTEPWEAHIFRSRLEAEGILAFIAHEYHVWMNWPLALALGGVKVQVPPEELEQARIVESNCVAGVYHAVLENEFGELDGLKCPHCGSTHIKSKRSYSDIMFLIAFYFAFGLIFPLWDSVHRCTNCNTTWRNGV